MSDAVYLQKLGSKFASLRESKGISQQKVSDASGISIRSISKFESGNIDIKVSTLIKYAKAIGIKPKDLL